jgi:hypothetical protein
MQSEGTIMIARETGKADHLNQAHGAVDPAISRLYRARRNRVDFVEVPQMGFAMVDGRGAPGGPEFTAAVQALVAVSYGAHLSLSRTEGDAPKVMPLEALWWIEGPDAALLMERLAMGGPGPVPEDQRQWHWRAMIMQLPPIDAAAVVQAVGGAKAKNNAKNNTGALESVRYEQWAEGPSAQIMHTGPYGEEQPDIAMLHQGIAEHGYRPRGRHHEIYLGDPRRSAPDRLRTILRHPYAAAP